MNYKYRMYLPETGEVHESNSVKYLYKIAFGAIRHAYKELAFFYTIPYIYCIDWKKFKIIFSDRDFNFYYNKKEQTTF